MRSHDISAAVQKHFPSATLLRFDRLLGGVSAEVFRIDLQSAEGVSYSVVLRVSGKSGLAAAQEFALQSALIECGIAVARPLNFDETGEQISKPYLFMEFIDGSSEVPSEHAVERICTMAETLSRIHATSLNSLPKLALRIDPLDGLQAWLPDDAEFAPLRNYCAVLDNGAYKGASVLLHGDFWPQNLIWNGGEIAAILDWEDAAIGDPLSDVACAVLELRYLYPESVVDNFLATYSRDTPIDVERLALWQVYVAAAAQFYMGNWGLGAKREAHMRTIALSQIHQASRILLGERRI